MKKSLLVLAAGLALGVSSAAQAAYTFVGSWQVDQGPSWTVVPPAYTGQDAAALLFGGSASSYSISTIGSSTATVDHLAWVSVWFAGSFPDCSGFPCGRKVSESAVTSTAGLYKNAGDESAYVRDWAVGARFTNYAFTGTAVPEPAVWALMIGGFGLVGSALRRRREDVVAA